VTIEWPPTGITLRSWSDYLEWAYPFEGAPPTTADTPPPGGIPTYEPVTPPTGYDSLTDLINPVRDLSLSYLSAVTCRNMVTGEDIPPELEQIALYATVLHMEQVTYRSTPEQRRSAISTGTGGLRSISAGPWSESYFGPGEVKYAWNVLDPDALLNSYLLALITPECLAIRQGMENGGPPGYAVQEIDWTGETYGFWWAGPSNYDPYR
jgi:hypothetical protein